MARRKYTREFKVSAVQLVNEQGYSPAQAAKSLGVDANSVRYWVKQLSSQADLAPKGEGAFSWRRNCGVFARRTPDCAWSGTF